LPLLRQVDRKLNLLKRVAGIMEKYDTRQKGKIEHGLHSMLAQRIYWIGCGYEDLNDHGKLRHDITWQTAAGEAKDLASFSTLCRFEDKSDRAMCMELFNLMIDVFVAKTFSSGQIRAELSPARLNNGGGETMAGVRGILPFLSNSKHVIRIKLKIAFIISCVSRFMKYAG
jgi:hypothetical protein